MMMENNNEEVVEVTLDASSSASEVLGALFGGDGDTLDKAGVFMLMDDIKNDSVRPAIEWIFRHNFSNNQPESLTMIINSSGGSVTDAFALIDTMKGSNIPIYTYGLGMIASCGLLTFIAGEKGKRFITKNTSILSHQFSWGSFGKEHELFAAVKEFDHTKQRIVDHYKKCTGLSEKDIKKYLLPPEDVWLSAKDAVRLGLADSIVEFY